MRDSGRMSICIELCYTDFLFVFSLLCCCINLFCFRLTIESRSMRSVGMMRLRVWVLDKLSLVVVGNVDKIPCTYVISLSAEYRDVISLISTVRMERFLTSGPGSNN